ncbi:MAG: Nmad3 family putative nucleotide modification protein [Halobacteriota archaeon]
MKAMLLRVGMDKGTDGALAPLFSDGSFVYIPPSEWDPASREERTYRTMIGWNGCPLSTYLSPRIGTHKPHDDPEFVTCTYGDASAKRRYLLRLQGGDLLVFYAGLQPVRRHVMARLYLIGYLTVEHIIDFNTLVPQQVTQCLGQYPNNAHAKQTTSADNLVIIVGNRTRSGLFRRALCISEGRAMKNGRIGQALSQKCEQLLGIRGFIERSMPPRIVEGERSIKALSDLLASKI